MPPRLAALAALLLSAAPAAAQNVAYAWGSAANGRLGNGQTTGIATSPGAVQNLGAGATAVSAGGDFSLAVLNGGAFSWGAATAGQLGNGQTSPDRSVAGPVSSLGSGVTAVSGGAFFGLAVQNGAAVAWGTPANGRLGNGQTSGGPVPTPALVNTLSTGVTAVSAGGGFGLAVQNGAAVAWGAGANGRLGNGQTSGDVSTPVAVQVLTSGVTDVSAGMSDHSLAIRDVDGPGVPGGAAYAWGGASDGKLGTGQTLDSGAPTLIPVLATGVTSVFAASTHSLAVQNGTVYAWGSRFSGQLGDGVTTGSNPTPTAVVLPGQGATPVVAVAGGFGHSLALLADGRLYSWGANGAGQLGIGTSGSAVLIPTLVPAPEGFRWVAVDANGSHTVALAAPVPEPLTVGVAAVVGLALLRVVRRPVTAAA